MRRAHTGISPSIRDPKSNEGDNAWAVICSKQANSSDWTSEAFDGVESLLALGPVALDAVTWLASTGPTAEVLRHDEVVREGLSVPFATVSQHGLGYAAMIFAEVDADETVRRHPDNIRWLCNVASMLHHRAQEEAQLRRKPAPAPPAPRLSPYGNRPTLELATMAEDHYLEHKQTLRYDVRTKQANPALEDAVIDRICGFWNADGGTLLIGVEDRSGHVTGLGPDLKLVKDEDALINRLNQRLLSEVRLIAPFVRITTDPVGDEQVLRIDVPVGDNPVFRDDWFFVRMNNSTPELKGQPLQDYIQSRFRRS